MLKEILTENNNIKILITIQEPIIVFLFYFYILDIGLLN